VRPAFLSRLRQDTELAGLAQKATEALQEIIQASGHQVEAEWDRATDAYGQPFLVLRLTNKEHLPEGTRPPEPVTGIFTPADLRDVSWRTLRLSQLWRASLTAREAAIWADYGPLLSELPPENGE